MSKNTTPAIVAILASLVCVLGWVSLPSLQSAQRRVDTQAAEHLERARRMLQQYSFGLAHKAVLLDQAYELSMDVEQEDSAWIADEEADNYQADHERLWEGYKPTDWPTDQTARPRPARANYGNLSGQIRTGLTSRSKILQENEQLLAGAIREINEALAVTNGSADSRSYAEANRLKAVALYHQGLAHSIRAKLKRNESQPLRGQLVELRTKVDILKNVEADNRIALTSEKIDELQMIAHKAKTEADTLNAKLSKLDDTIADFKRRIDQATKTRDARLADMQSLRKIGLDFSNPNGAEDFTQRYQQIATAYRSADRLVQTLVGGDLPHAQIDASSDYIQGKYLENGTNSDLTVSQGLTHYLQKRDILSEQLSAAQSSVTAFEEGIQVLEGMQAMFEQQRSKAQQALPTLAKTARDLHDELSRLEAEAFTFEDDALAALKKSASSARQAATNAQNWVSQARAQIQSLAPEAKSISPFQTRTQDGWMAGHIASQEADALLEQARIYLHRYRTQQLDAAILAELAKPLNLREADPQALQEAALEAQTAGVDAVRTAMMRLHKAHREANRHWTIVAQQASANEILTLLDQPGYDKDALTAYRNAIKGRESESFAQPFLARIHQLESN